MSADPYASLNLAGHVGDDPAAVTANRAAVAAHLGIPPARLALMDAVHGAEVAEVRTGGVVAGVDVLVTCEPGVAVMAMGADCVPMGLVGADGITVAAAHCGWRGLAADVTGAAVAALRDRGTQVAYAVLGPSVCGACYPVPLARAEQVRRAVSDEVGRAALVGTADGQPGVDVRRGARARLLELGVPADAIRLVGGCTVEDPVLFSYRRDGVTGRQGVALCSLEASGGRP